MINSIFFCVGFYLFLSFSMGGMSYSGIHRSFQNMHRSVLEVAVVTIGTQGADIKPYFNEKVLEQYVTEYLVDNVGRYSKDFKANIIYFDADTREINTNHKANGVKISIYSYINPFFTYQHAREFTIDQKGNL